jgi:hypothetical protein
MLGTAAGAMKGKATFQDHTNTKTLTFQARGIHISFRRFDLNNSKENLSR